MSSSLYPSQTIGKIGSEHSSLDGVLDWIRQQGGTVTPFNAHVDAGIIKGYAYRFFRSEGWIGLRTPECPPGKCLPFETMEEFIRAIDNLPSV